MKEKQNEVLYETQEATPVRQGIHLAAGQGRLYPMGGIEAVFKADGAETDRRYNASEWWLAPHTRGPGAHSHPEDDIFYVLAGTISILAGEQWIDCPPGSFVLAPGGLTHDFENRGEVRAGVLNFSFPGEFEPNMPAIADWFAKHPPGRAGAGPAVPSPASAQPAADGRQPVILMPGAGRTYEMGRMRAVFKADGAETDNGYTISEWWLEPHSQGPGAHRHPEDGIFYVFEGVMSLLMGEDWVEASAGDFVLIPGGMRHDFQNRGPQRAGMLHFGCPGGFEAEMPGIVSWFADHPIGDA